MKIIQINAVYGIGSTGTIVKDIDDISQANGWESFVAYSYATSPPKNGYQIGTYLGKKIHSALCRIGGKQAYYSRWTTIKFIAYLKKVQPDIVHLHNLHNNYIHLNLLLKYLSNAPCKVIITQHDCWYYTGKCFHYTAKGCFKWQNGCDDCAFRSSDTPAFLFDSVDKVWKDKKKYLNAIENLTVVSVSDWLTNETKKSFLKEKCLLTIHNGVDIEIFKPADSPFREQYKLQGKFVILGMANKWLSTVNTGVLDYVMDSLNDRYALVLIGCSQQQMNQIKRKDTILLGYIYEQTELAKLYSMADVFVNLTHEDSLPTVNLESQACGTPVISYSVSGTPETFCEQTGIAVTMGSLNELTNAIITISSQPKSKYSPAAIQWIEQNFQKQNKYDEYMKLYHVLVSEG